MTTLAIIVLLVVILDQGVKHILRVFVSPGSLSLGAFGDVRVVSTQVWAIRALGRVPAAAMWIIWTAAAAAAIAISMRVPTLAWALGLLLGGALSHALETSLRGSVCDYVCLRFWPAFNLADVAICGGALTLVLHVAAALS